MKKKLLGLLVIAMLCCTLTGCKSKKATITTTVYPVKYIVETLMGDKVDVRYISTEEFIQRATLVDDWRTILESTDLFLYIGELEPYMDIYESDIQSFDMDIINLASLSAIDLFKRYTVAYVNDSKVFIESDYYESDIFDQIDTYNKDPFIWLDPIAAASMASTIKDWLESYYPEESLTIESNFKQLQAELVIMDTEYQNINNLNNVSFVTVTASFGNWQKAYGIQVYPLIISKYGVIPNENQLYYIEEIIKANKVKYIVKDETLPADLQELYEKVKTDLKLTEIKLSSLSILSEDDKEKNKDFITVMYDNLMVLEDTFKD